MEHQPNTHELLVELGQLVESFKRLHTGASKVVNHKNAKELTTLFDLALGDSNDQNTLLPLLEQFIEYSVKTGHHQYFNQLFGGFNSAAVLGDLVASLFNTSLYTFEVAPVATLMEEEVIRKMNSYAGFVHGGGIFTSGGSNSNMVALLVARNSLMPETMSEGIFNQKPTTFFVSDQSHYSFQKAAYTLGIGIKNLVKVKSLPDGKMDPSALRQAIQLSQSKGEQPFFVAATAGTTELGVIDNILECGNVAREFGLWFHVDGSWGGSLILSKKYRHLFKGLEQADSFAWNAHKLMNIPFTSSLLLLKDGNRQAEMLGASDTEYIFHDHDDSQHDLGSRTLQCGRRNEALKVWFAWKAIGDQGYASRIENLMELANYAEKLILDSPLLELLAPVETLNINFRYYRSEIDNLDHFNKLVRNRLIAKGISMVNYCMINEQLSIRLVLVNGELKKEDINVFFENFVAEANALFAETLPFSSFQ